MDEKKIEIQKPITIKREEFKQQLVDLINNSMLPAFVIEPLLTEILRETSAAVIRQYEYDLQQYNDAVKDNTHENEE